MNITITGASGFVGTNLFNYLKSSYILELLSVRYKVNQQFKVNADVFIHLAGKAHDLKNSSNFKEYFEVNTKLAQDVFDAFIASNCKDFIFFSSVKAVTDKADALVTEKTSTNPISAYGQSKLQAEQYILSQNLPQGKRVFIIRPAMIHGPGNKGNLNLLYQIVKKGFPWPLGAFNNQRSFCSIDNVCFVIQQILERKEIPSGVYNLCDDEALSTNELIELIATTINKKPRMLSIPKKLVVAVARLGDVLHLPINTERLDKLTENFVVDNSKIKMALQIDNMPVTTKEGLTKTVQYFNR